MVGKYNMYESKLINAAGSKFLKCWYDNDLRNWDEVITRALQKHRLKVGEVTILCMPHKKKLGQVSQFTQNERK